MFCSTVELKFIQNIILTFVRWVQKQIHFVSRLCETVNWHNVLLYSCAKKMPTEDLKLKMERTVVKMREKYHQ